MSQKIKQLFSIICSILILIGLDQWTKQLAVDRLKGKNPFVLWNGVFELRYLENRGAAFGMLQGKQSFFFLVALAVLAAAIFFFLRLPCSRHYLPLGICGSGIVAGAVGNMIDRVSQGYVVDFLYFSLIDFPIFNVADCYVTIGAGLLAFLVLIYYKDEDFAVFSLKKGGRAG
ncbi:signal peptidase II [Lachnospiraceae bacterium 62-35]